MLKLALATAALFALAAASCTDKKDNVVQIGDTSGGQYNAHFQNAMGATYDKNGNPSCHDSAANLRLPGVLQLISGSLVVKNAMNLVGNTEVLLTLKKDSWLIGTVCEHGSSKNPLIPDKDCKFAFCSNATSLCTALGTPGTHSLGEIEGDLGINGTIALPQLSDAINGILKGKWQATLDIQSAGKTVASIKVPTNEQWINVEE